MGVVPFRVAPDPAPSVIFQRLQFDMDRKRILIISYDQEQFSIHNEECNTSYDLRVGSLYRDHRDNEGRTLSEGQSIELLPGQAVIIETEEEVQFPRGIFGHILPKVSLLQKGIANTPSKVDPGYSGHLLITAFNHGKQNGTPKAARAILLSISAVGRRGRSPLQ